jgi:hypothetical protein
MFRRRNRKGSAIVEAALALLVVANVLIGIVDVGQILVFHQGLAERARAGARWAVVNPYDSEGIKNMVVYNSPEPGAAAKPFFYLDKSMVSTSLLNSGTPEARVVVTISGYTFRFFTPVIARAYTARPITVSMPIEEM